MAGVRWLFSKEKLANTPSIKRGLTETKECAYRQQAANLIQSMGQRLQLNQLCMNTAIVYMHRFYMYHPLQKFQWRDMSAACLFLAAKVEEQPRKLELVIKAAHYVLGRGEDGSQAPLLDTKSQEYLEKVQDLVINENILLQALGFNVTIDHSNTHVVKLCQLVKAPKELSQTSYFLSTNSLLLTNMCLQYPSTVIASVCIHLACKWSDWELPRSNEGKPWWHYVDPTLTLERLEEITREFLSVMEKADPKLKRQIMARLKVPADSSPNSRSSSPAPPFPARVSQHTSNHSHSTNATPDRPHSSKSTAPPSTEGPPKTYAEHKERASKSRPIHGESPLVRGDAKRSYPKDSHSSLPIKVNSISSNMPPHNPYNIPSSLKYNNINESEVLAVQYNYDNRFNIEKTTHTNYTGKPYSVAIAHYNKNHDNRHHYRSHSGQPMDGSPIKRPRLGENGNGEQRPPLPPQPPLPKPPLPP